MRPPNPADIEAAELIARFNQALSLTRLHELGNAALEQPVADLDQAIEAVHRRRGRVVIQFDASNDLLFLNERPVKPAAPIGTSATRQATRRVATASIEGFGRALAAMGVGEIRIVRPLEARVIRSLLNVLKKVTGATPELAWTSLEAALAQTSLAANGVTFVSAEKAGIRVLDSRSKVEVDEDSALRLAYARLLALLHSYLKNLSDPTLNAYFARKLVRAVQGVQALAGSRPMEILALALVKGADEYPFAHAVNTCLLSILLAQRLGLSKMELTRTGLAALLHGIGKFRTRESIVAKPAAQRTPAEAEDYRRHAYRAVDALLESRHLDENLVTCALVAFDLEGPGGAPTREPRAPHPIAAIVSVAEAFDALTTSRPGAPGLTPVEALQRLEKGDPRPQEPTLVAVFVNVMGLFPPGTVVCLDSGEIAVVVHPCEEDPKRPVVEVVRTARGEDLEDGEIVDLLQKSPEGKFARSIASCVSAAQLGIKIPEYLKS